MELCRSNDDIEAIARTISRDREELTNEKVGNTRYTDKNVGVSVGPADCKVFKRKLGRSSMR
jgi:hypothetical protein